MYISESSQTLLHDPLPFYDSEQPSLQEISARDSANPDEISETVILHLSAVSVVLEIDTTVTSPQTTQYLSTHVETTEYALMPVNGSIPTAISSPQAIGPNAKYGGDILTLAIVVAAASVILSGCLAMLAYLYRKSWNSWRSVQDHTASAADKENGPVSKPDVDVPDTERGISEQVSDLSSRCEASPVSPSEISGSSTLAIISEETNGCHSCDLSTALGGFNFDPPFDDCFEFEHDSATSGRQTPDTPESVRCPGRAEIAGLNSDHRPPPYTETVAL